jgi:hypothetical protein
MDILTNTKDAEARPLTFLPSTISGKTLPQLVTEFATLFNPDTAP